MNPPTETAGLALNISAVEREAGLSKDVLRMWESVAALCITPGAPVHANSSDYSPLP